MDVHDAVSGIMAVLNNNPNKWKNVYCFGSNNYWNIIDIAKTAISIGKEFNFKNTEYIVDNSKEIVLDVGMDSSQFMQDMNWKPKWSLEDTIRSIFTYYLPKK